MWLLNSWAHPTHARKQLFLCLTISLVCLCPVLAQPGSSDATSQAPKESEKSQQKIMMEQSANRANVSLTSWSLSLFHQFSVCCLLIFCKQFLTAISGNSEQQRVIFLTCTRPHFSQLYPPPSYAFLIFSGIFIDLSVSSHGNLFQPLSFLASLPGVSPLQHHLLWDRHPGYATGV